MIKINILSGGFISPNSYGFLLPLIANKNKLREYNIDINFYYNISPKIFECNIIIIESKFYTNLWKENSNYIYKDLLEFKNKIDKVCYFSISDSSTFDHALMLPYVDRYFKNQILVNKDLYREEFYGNRYYADYYNKNFNIIDSKPTKTIPVTSSADLIKIHLGWNSGLVNWSLLSTLKMSFYSKINSFFKPNNLGTFYSPSKKRLNNLSARFNTNYNNQSVSYQRRAVQNLLSRDYKTIKINRYKYFKELKNSKIVYSPFGLGEITLKDFEVFLTGGILYKPNMGHMKTWPNFFIENSTYISHKLNLDDFLSTIQHTLDNYNKLIEIAHNAQNLYKKYNIYHSDNYLFCEYFSKIIRF